jgi:hypothetical protein
MAEVITIPDLHTKPYKTAISGLQADFRSIALTEAQDVDGNLVVMGVLPAGCRLHDLFLESDDLEGNAGAPTLTLDVGILNSNLGEALDDTPALVAGKNFITASTVGQAGGRAGFTATLNPGIDIGVDYVNDRLLTVKINTPATAAAGSLGLGWSYFPA